MRRLLLWMARNSWLRQRVPRLRFARRAVRRFMPGEDAAAALAAAREFQRSGIGTLFTRLGENLLNVEEADATAAHYLGLIEQLEAARIDGEISVKPTQLGMDLDASRTEQHVGILAERAARSGGVVWLDMEGSAYTAPTIELYERLKASHPNVGICLQAYLRRTPADVQRLLPLEPAIRLVKGAYDEPASIAFHGRREVDASYASIVAMLLASAAAGRRLRIGLGTHDVALIEQAALHAAALGMPRTAFEVQMLNGIRLDQQRRLAADGYVVRDLIAYGTAWYAWYMRRLAERPANVLFALRQLLP